MKRRYLAIVITVVLALSLITGGVFAILKSKTDAVANTFTEATDPVIEVEETMANNVKSDVKVDVGTPGYSVYVRAAVVATWVDADGNVLGRIPAEGTDYSVTYNTVSAVTGEKQWFKGTDGFFYYSSPVVSGSTENLINECKPLVNPEAGYHLKVEIVSQVIQALGSTDADSTPAVVDAWGVTLNSDNLITASK